MAKKSGRIIVTLECTEARALGKPVSRYTTTKNKQKNFFHLAFFGAVKLN